MRPYDGQPRVLLGRKSRQPARKGGRPAVATLAEAGEQQRRRRPSNAASSSRNPYAWLASLSRQRLAPVLRRQLRSRSVPPSDEALLASCASPILVTELNAAPRITPPGGFMRQLAG